MALFRSSFHRYIHCTPKMVTKIGKNYQELGHQHIAMIIKVIHSKT